jgi:hypothetical protein
MLTQERLVEIHVLETQGLSIRAIQKAMECVWTDETLGSTNWLKVDFSDYFYVSRTAFTESIGYS